MLALLALVSAACSGSGSPDSSGGTPDKFAPACQETVGGGQSKTELVVRWQPYLVHVTISRLDRDWAGDPEVALAISRVLAQRLGVEEAAGDG